MVWRIYGDSASIIPIRPNALIEAKKRLPSDL
jgi:hypothetical protein